MSRSVVETNSGVAQPQPPQPPQAVISEVIAPAPAECAVRKRTGMSGAELANAWHRFKHLGDTGARARIINQYAYLVKITAGRVVSNLPPSLERDDLVSAGVVGLIKAVD